MVNFYVNVSTMMNTVLLLITVYTLETQGYRKSLQTKYSTVKPLFIVFVGGLKKKQWIRENNRCGSHS
jgi:hypothetical protein